MGIVSFTASDGNKHFADSESKAYQKHLKGRSAAAQALEQGEVGTEFSMRGSSTLAGAVENILEPLADDVELAQKAPRSRKPKAAEA